MKRRDANLRTLARRQRWLIWLVGVSILSQMLSFLPWWGQYHLAVIISLIVMYFAIFILMIVGVILVLIAQRNHPLIVVLCGILMIAPCGNLLLLILVNMSATRTLRRAGLHVGFWGVKDEDIERILDPMLCRGCGYNLTGNISGICPECGRPLDADQRTMPSSFDPMP
jgi:hypothetical protein